MEKGSGNLNGQRRNYRSAAFQDEGQPCDPDAVTVILELLF